MKKRGNIMAEPEEEEEEQEEGVDWKKWKEVAKEDQALMK